MIKISPYEEKFLEILNGVNSITKFENWLFENEEVLTKELPCDIYNELILLNYTTKESKHELSRVLDIDFEKLELYEIQKLIMNGLEKESFLNSINYDIDVYELDYISFEFQIGTLKFRMHNPFKINDFANLKYSEIEKIFYKNFGNGIQFLQSLLESIGTNNFRVHNWKKFEQTDSMTETKLIETKDDEYKILINGHYGFINKKYIKHKMKKAWLH